MWGISGVTFASEGLWCPVNPPFCECSYNINGDIGGFPWWKCDIGIFLKINLNKVRIFYPPEKISRLIK